MKQKIVFGIYLFLFSIMYIHSSGEMDMKTAAQKRDELEQYPIKVAPISLPGTTLYDFVFIDADKIILIKPKQLIEINLSTNEQKPIALPDECSSNEFMGFKGPNYDKETNSVHMLFQWFFRELSPARRHTYHIFHLDNYSWETIEELGKDLRELYWYDSANKQIYIQGNKFLLKFDLVSREILEYIALPDFTSAIFCIYGNPFQILASTRSMNISGGLHFFIYDVAANVIENFPESIYNMDTDFFSLNYYIPYDDNKRFIGVARRRGDISSIAIMDLNANTIETVALDGFPYGIYDFKKIYNGKYAFMVAVRNRFGNIVQSFLCILDYP
jgi:hypothetical protein